MNRTLLITLASLLVAATVNAAPSDSHYAVYGLLGAENHDIGGLNAAMRSSGMNTFPETKAGFGLGGQISIRRFLFDMEVHGFASNIQERPYESTLSGGMGLFNVGYSVWRSERFHIYPLIGFGGGGMTLHTEGAAANDFNTALTSYNENTMHMNGAFILNAALGLDRRIPMKKSKVGPMFGIRIGYRYSPTDNEWHDREPEYYVPYYIPSAVMAKPAGTGASPLKSSPDAGFTGAYVRVLFGLGSI